jgi:hypothetical protein
MTGATTGRPRMVRADTTTALEPVSFTDPETTEAWLQQLLHRHPDLLPIDEISTAWGPLVSLGQEIPLPVGFIDNLYVSPAGEVTVGEAKLWRNPEARRKVVGQILDYAAALKAMSYDDLDQAVRAANAGDDRSIWQRVLDSDSPPSIDTEASFVDTVARNLAGARFLLLIVGDGIRSDLQGLADLLASHPTLGFHLELVEVRIYRVPGDDALLVVPNLVGRTDEVTRAVIEIRNPNAADVSVAVDLPAPARPTAAKYASIDDFRAALADNVDAARADATVALIQWWRDQRRGLLKFNKRSINLSSPYQHTPGGSISVMTLYDSGIAEGSVAPMSEWRGIISRDDAMARYEAAGFRGDPAFPKADLDCTVTSHRERIEELLIWADELIRSASAAGPPTTGE